MQGRIERLRDQITQLLALAKSADQKAARELRLLAYDMQKVVSELEERIPPKIVTQRPPIARASDVSVTNLF
jgi:hypothetical protein